MAHGEVGFVEAGSAPVHVVYPTGLWPADVQKVQAAVDVGGTVLLKAHSADGAPTPFNFGTPERLPGRIVRLNTDVVILGETAGSSMTTIEGGQFPFLGVAKAHTRISGIHFVGPLVSAIIIVASTGAEIVGNRVTNVVGGFLPFLGLSEGRGIKFLGNSDPDGAITGRIVVSNNVLEDLHTDLSDAIVFDRVAADVVISANRVQNVGSSAMLLIDGAGKVTIDKNHLEPGPGELGGFGFGNGITIIGSRGASYRIAANRVLAENPLADGILLIGDLAPIERAVVLGNHVSLQGSDFGALTFLENVSEAVVSRNSIDGAGATALGLFTVGLAPDPVAASNVLAMNDVAAFNASAAHVFLDSHTTANTIVGCHGTVIDLGVENGVRGCAGPGGPASAKVAEGGRVHRISALRGTTTATPAAWVLAN